MLVFISCIVLISSALLVNHLSNNTAQAAAGFLDAKYLTLTLDRSKTSSTLTNFPVYVHLSTHSGVSRTDVSDIFTTLGSDANQRKIAVYTSDNATQCYVEIEKWDTASKDAVLWVKVPSYSNTANTKLYLYYDPAEADNSYVGGENSAAAKAVWDSDYQLVMHLDETAKGTTGEYKDSTSYQRNGTAGGGSSTRAPALTTGMTGYGQNFDGTDDYLEIPDNDAFSVTTTNALTVSLWISPADINMAGGSGYIRFGGKGDDNEQEWQFVLYDYGFPDRSQRIGVYTYSPSGGLGAGDYVQKPWSVNQWIYVTGVWTCTTPQAGIEYIYLNQTSVKTAADSWQKYSLNYQNRLAPVRFGIQYWGGGWFQGRMDEIRISDVVRSNDWIDASYYSEADQLITYNGEPPVSTPKPTSTATVKPTVYPTATVKPTATPTPTPTAPDADLVSSTMPSVMQKGNTYTVSITLKNTGNIPWNESAQIRLGSALDASSFGTSRIKIASGVNVKPGQSYTWTFNMTAPSSTGTYRPAYRVVWENHSWFGDTVAKNVTVTSGTGTQSYTIDLVEGWNLVSIPLTIPNYNIASVFPSSVRSHIVNIWGWNESKQNWEYYSPNSNDYFYHYYPSLTTLKTGKAYWVEMNATASFTVQGTVPSGAPASPVKLTSGWNFVGPTGFSSTAPKTLYTSAVSVWGWDEAKQNWVYYSTDSNDYFYKYYPKINYIQATNGYWVEIP